jgi:putative DNA primase/helicase
VVPFDTVIPDDQQDPDLRRRLVEDHRPAILAWLVRGARSWHAEGLGTAGAVETATEEYKATQDTLGAFLAERTQPVATTKTKVGDLFGVWRDWCASGGESPGRLQDFSAALANHDLKVDEHRGTKFIVGMGIRADRGGS